MINLRAKNYDRIYESTCDGIFGLYHARIYGIVPAEVYIVQGRAAIHQKRLPTKLVHRGREN